MNPLPLSSPAAGLFAKIREALPRWTLVVSRSVVARHPGTASPRMGGLLEKLEALSDEELLGAKVLSRDFASLVRAGLFLRAEQFEAAHEISQKIPSAEGSYWHGILHRREPDYSNAKYWFARVRSHPVFTELLKIDAGSLPGGGTAWKEISRGGTWNAAVFVDLCEACVEGTRSGLCAELESLQEIEMQALLEYCAARALGEEKKTGRRGEG